MTQGLAKKLGLFSLIVYGIGDILGAGIYALVGKVIDSAGNEAWISFLAAALVALITGLSYAELSSRFPVSAGAAAFVRRGFPGQFMATFAGVMVLGTGLSSAATVSVAFGGYLQQITSLPALFGQGILLFGTAFLAFWGIRESSRVNFLFTFLEVLGLLAVIGFGYWLLNGNSFADFFRQTLPAPKDWNGVLGGVTLAFYAYIGFEDLANLAEESKNPSRDLPKAILIAIGVSTVLYLAVAIILLVNLPLEAIRGSDTPLLLIFEKAGLPRVNFYFSWIALFAISNTGLINLIMASRLMYGMSREGLLPATFGKVHAKRQTPWVGVLTSLGIIFLLLLSGGLKALAQTTSFLITLVFLLIHLSLIRVKLRQRRHAGIHFPLFVPILGLGLCLVLTAQFPAAVWLRSLPLFLLSLILWWFYSRKRGLALPT